MTSTEQLKERAAGPAMRDGAAAVVAVVVAGLLFAVAPRRDLVAYYLTYERLS